MPGFVAAKPAAPNDIVTSHHHRPQPTPSSAVRAELRAALHDLSEKLAQQRDPDEFRILDAIMHSWALVRLAELDEVTHTLVAQTLEALTRDLDTEMRLDTDYFAYHLALAADRV